MKLRAPAVPLITVDPYFSVWSSEECLNYTKTMHWTGKSNSIIGTVTVDGEELSFLGYHRNLHKLPQVSLEITALSTVAVYENEAIRVTVTFTSPLLLGDYERMSRPVSYMEVCYCLLDGQAHEVLLKVRAEDELCLDRKGQSPVITEQVQISDTLRGMRMGNSVQAPLNRDGDDLRIDWGYFYLMMEGEGVQCSSPAAEWGQCVMLAAPMREGERRLVLFAYDDIASIEYFGKPLRSYWNRNGKTIEAAISEAAAEYDGVMKRATAFSDTLYADALAAGGEQYAELLSLAYRQVIAAHKLVLDENGELLFISKECFSNGCAATVDVSYPSVPLFLLYDPELAKGMLRPIYRYATSSDWREKYRFDFAPHDVGRYPLLNGQVYGYNRETGEMSLAKQMPVEECGNMLIMEAAVAIATGKADFAAAHMDVLEGWVKYLIDNGRDPENQLCTDDFAGHLAHNCNLSLKAIMGIAGFSILLGMLGKKEEEARYMALAREMAADFEKRAANGDGSFRLAYDRPGTFSMKYNMVWDKLWHTNLFSQALMDAELTENARHFNTYGMPLDSRADYTKSDWLVWTASMASDKETFASFISPLWQAYHNSPSRVPMTDWYDTVSARIVSFQNRTVQGGLFMKLLMEKTTKN